VCGKEFQSAAHYFYHHSVVHREFKCDECGEKVIGKNALKKHKRKVKSANVCLQSSTIGCIRSNIQATKIALDPAISAER